MFASVNSRNHEDVSSDVRALLCCAGLTSHVHHTAPTKTILEARVFFVEEEWRQDARNGEVGYDALDVAELAAPHDVPNTMKCRMKPIPTSLRSAPVPFPI